jgi:aminoglycoside phosphotransferase family enzyme
MLVEAAAAGELTPTEAAGLGQLVAGFHGIAQADELQRRIEAIEAALKAPAP